MSKELYQQITDACFEEGEVTKPMVDRLEQLFKNTMLDLIDDCDPATGSTKPNSAYWGNVLRRKVKEL